MTTSEPTSSFATQISAAWSAGKAISVGLDGELSRLPEGLDKLGYDGIVEFHRRIISATADIAAVYKPQIAGYEAMGREGADVLRRTIDLVRELAPGVPVILDAKRADIGSTNDKYIEAIFGFYGADAVTVHPYLGLEAMRPFLDQADRGVIILCRTSNPGAGRYQDLIVEGRPLYSYIAQDVAEAWNYNGNCGLVVGATYPTELGVVRGVVGDLPLLVPGVGAQGGDVEATVKAGSTASGGLLLHASRSLMYAYENHPDLSVIEAIRLEAENLWTQIRRARTS